MVTMTPAASLPSARASAERRVITVKKTVTGGEGSAGQWGVVEVTLVVKKTTTIVGTKKTVKRTITGLDVPIYPDHTGRSVLINQQALPMLEQETLAAHYSPNIQMISGATFTSEGFIQSLQSALLKARSV
jgi:uncharacterized protein with FMN-binding domain